MTVEAIDSWENEAQSLAIPKYRLFVSTGEVSGDLQGARLIEALKRQAENLGMELEILAMGGDRMAEAGAVVLANTSAIGSIGIFESVPHLRSTFQIQHQIKRALLQTPPDLVVLIDYFNPNMGIGGFVRQRLPHIPITYYIAPQEWVWALSQYNTEQVLRLSDRLLAIFPGEAQYYQERGGEVTWVGHPLVDWIQTAPSREQARKALAIEPEQVAIALIPASRPQELTYILPVMFEAARQIQAQLPQAHFWIPLALETYRSSLEQAIEQYGLRATLVSEQSQTVIAAADLAIAKSGTVNLETALLKVPQVVVYRVNPFTAWIAKHILKFSAPFISPPNLVQMKPIVPELLQDEATPARIVQESLDILLNPSRQQQMQAAYQDMQQALGEKGVCDRAAKEILHLLPKREKVMSNGE